MLPHETRRTITVTYMATLMGWECGECQDLHYHIVTWQWFVTQENKYIGFTSTRFQCLLSDWLQNSLHTLKGNQPEMCAPTTCFML